MEIIFSAFSTRRLLPTFLLMHRRCVIIFFAQHMGIGYSSQSAALNRTVIRWTNSVYAVGSVTTKEKKFSCSSHLVFRERASGSHSRKCLDAIWKHIWQGSGTSYLPLRQGSDKITLQMLKESTLLSVLETVSEQFFVTYAQWETVNMALTIVLAFGWTVNQSMGHVADVIPSMTEFCIF
jgi:hypothetical protein